MTAADNKIEVEKIIKRRIQAFSEGNLTANALDLFQTLGYNTERQSPLDRPTYNAFKESWIDIQSKFSEKNALVTEWKYVDLLFQLSKEEVLKQTSLFDTKRVDNAAIESYLFFTIELSKPHYSRTELSRITREVNSPSMFKMPIMILFKHGSLLTLSIINRRLHKRDESRDVLEKVTLIKDIQIQNPHRAHIEILFDLSFDELKNKFNFTNFVELHNAWQKTLDTKELNKRFYLELANWYFWAIQNVEFPGDAEKNRDVRNATSVIRLLTRLIFIWFIKEKGLVPDDLFNHSKLKHILNYNDKNQSTYYKAILQNLFFATLNTEMNKDKPDSRKFRGKGKDGGRDQHYMIHNVLRYEDYFITPDEILKKYFENIPFLNGGLFECLDRKITVNGQDKVIRIDGFSEHTKNVLKVPDQLFFSNEQTIDLNEVYGTKNKIYKVKGLIDILDGYKFTIDENTPIEEEVALDPELLGKVFENLLASYNPETQTTARKQTGSFYTPREIVNYMVDESLIAYLTNAIDVNNRHSRESGNPVVDIPSPLWGEDEGNNADFRLRHLLSYTDELHKFTHEEVDTLINAIDNVKILDPACGSGAFPMGILHKLVYILGKLDPNNEKWKQKQINKVLEVPDVTVREKLLEDIEQSFRNNELDYGRKLYLIENSIFGVDIQPIAVQIAKLRFFISLIVDQKISFISPPLAGGAGGGGNLGIRPLPNLETKFVAANTLIGIEKPQQLLLRNPEIDKKEEELKKVRERHFTARTPKTKEKYRHEDERLRVEISELLKRDGFPRDTTEKMAQWNPYDQSMSAAFFDPEWMFSLREGFDIVMGNPPYLRVQGLQQTQPQFVPVYRQRYVSAQGSFDIYALFVERGFQLLDRTGHLTYILPHKFFQASFGGALRKLLTENKALHQIVRFGAEQVFEEATTYTCLLFLSRQPNMFFDLIEVRTLAKGAEVLNAAWKREEHPDYNYERLPEPSTTDWDFTIGESNKVLSRLRQHPKTLENVIRKIFQGIATSADKLYVLPIVENKGEMIRCYSKFIDKEIEIEKGLVKTFLMGKDVHRYDTVEAKNVVIFPYLIQDGRATLMSQQYIAKNFPQGWKYLQKNEEALGARERGRMHGNEFYAYIYPKNLTEFETVKIMTPDICSGPQMTIDLSGKFYHTTTLYSFVFKPSVQESPKYFLGLLNSKVLWYFLSVTGTILRGGYLRFKTEYLKPFPIPESTAKQQRQIETLVEYILYLKAHPAGTEIQASSRHSLMISYFEQIVDGLVYELYFPEEFNSSNSRLSSILDDTALPSLQFLKGKKLEAIEDLFHSLYTQDNPVRKAIYFLDTIEAVRAIEVKSCENK